MFPNQAFLRDVFQPGQLVVLYGTVEFRGSGGLQLSNPEYEVIRGDADEDDATVHTGRIVPIYEKAGSVTTRMQRTLVHRLLSEMPAEMADPVPEAIRRAAAAAEPAPGLADTHFPPAQLDVEELNAFRSPAQQRLIFEEFFLFQAGLVLRKRAARGGPQAASGGRGRSRFASRRARCCRSGSRPGRRRRCVKSSTDMQRPEPMNRLLQGDVGAGKTIVALLAALVAMENGLQVAFMAPTEILADQHYLTIRRLLDQSRFRVATLTGSATSAKRRETLAELAGGAVHLVVGTHALVEEAVAFSELGLVVIDEQHRFGVVQRATLRAKGVQPDVLVMTATPIPRTLALTAFGDLDVSVIRDLPPGRQPIVTMARPESRRDEVYGLVRRELEQGRQAYVIYPLVEESTKVDLRAATAMAEHLQAKVFPEFRWRCCTGG